MIAATLTLVSALAASPWSGPECWDRMENLNFGVTLEGVPQPVGLPIYLQGQLFQPRFYEQNGALWLGDINQLLRYNPDIDQFESMWKSGEETGVFAFAGGSYLWTRGGADERRGGARQDFTLDELALDGPEPRLISHTLRIGDPSDPRWARPVALLSAASAGHARRVLLIIELQPTEEQPDQSAIYDIELRDDQVELRGHWTLSGIFDRYALVPGGAGEHDVLLMLSHSDKLLGLILDEADWARPPEEARAPVLLVDEDLTALADPDPNQPKILVYGGESACVKWIELQEDHGELSEVPLRAWCPHDSQPYAPGTDRVRSLSSLSGGRVFVTSDPGRQRSTTDGPQLESFFLTPAGTNGYGEDPLPLPLRESTYTVADRKGTWHLDSAYGDSSGRLWATASRRVDVQVRVQRLDMPFEPLDTVFGRSVLESVAFDGGFAALVQDAEGGLSLETLSLMPRSSSQLARFAADETVSIAAGQDALYALVVGPASSALWRWRGAGASAEILRLPPTDTPPSGFWLDGDRLRLRFGPPESAYWLGYSIGPDDEARPDGGQGIACAPPDRLPSIVGEDLICVRRGGDAITWTLGPEGAQSAIPVSSGGWALQQPGSKDLLRFRVVGQPGGERLLSFNTRQEAQPLFLSEDPAGVPWLFLLSSHQILRVNPAGESRAIAQRGPQREQRELLPTCRPLFERTERGAVELGVDPAGLLWLTFFDPDGGAPLTFLGPLLPFMPKFRASPNPFRPLTIRVADGEATDPRLTLASSCATGSIGPLLQGVTLKSGWELWPSRECEITLRNNHGMAMIHTQRFYSATGLFGSVATLSFALGGAGLVFFRRRKERDALRSFAEQAKSPYVVGPPVRGRMFVGRERLVDELMQSILEGGFFGLVADEKRIGKTSLLLRLQELLTAQSATGRPCRAIYFSMERSAGGTLFFQELWRPLGRIAREQGLANDMPYPSPSNEHEAFTNFGELLNRLHEQEGACIIVLLIDEMQMLAGSDVGLDARDAAQRLRSLTAEISRDRLSWVAAGVAGMLKHQHKDTDSDLLLVGPRYSLGALDEDSALKLIRQPIAGLPVSFSAEAEQEILRFSRGHPFVIQYTCRTLFTNSSLDIMGGGAMRRATIDAAAVLRFTRDNPIGHLLESAPEPGDSPLGEHEDLAPGPPPENP